jgi:hypothetical protein
MTAAIVLALLGTLTWDSACRVLMLTRSRSSHAKVNLRV